MTNTREIIAYALAHLGGYVVGMVLHQAVVIPMLTQMGMLGSHMGMIAIFFLINLVIQIGVFFAFIAIRGRRAAQ